jgi:hypothetical protein
MYAKPARRSTTRPGSARPSPGVHITLGVPGGTAADERPFPAAVGLSRPLLPRRENRTYVRVLVDAIGTYSNLASLREKYTDLRKRVLEAPPRPPLLRSQAPPARTKRFLTESDATDIAQRYEAGETTRQIGTRHAISKTRVATVLREQGITIRRQGLTDEQVAEAAMLYVKGKSLSWLGIRFNVSHTTVATALRRQGIQPRPRPGWRCLR